MAETVSHTLAPVKTLVPCSTHLLCTHCKRLYSNPVINIHCGHTFCKECALSNAETNLHTKCPIDSVTCSTASLVVNRAIISQIEDLEIHCKYGLVWSESIQDYEINPQGCQQIITLGKRKVHEDQCDYTPESCPNSSDCGPFPRRLIPEHLVKCNKKACPHEEKGCEYKSTQENVASHAEQCGYRCLQVVPGNLVQIRKLEQSNTNLKSEVTRLNERVAGLEQDKLSMEAKMNECFSTLKYLEGQFNQVNRELERLKSVKKVSSESKPRLSSSSRSPSQSSVVVSPRHESWTMPCMFKLIGTLRSHTDVVWCLCTRGSMMYSCGDDTCIKFWDLEALEKGCKQTIKAAHNGQVQSLEVGDDFLFSGGFLKPAFTFVLYIITSAEEVHTLAVSEDFLYSGGEDGSLKAWMPLDGSLVKVVENAHNNVIAAMICSEDYLFTSSHTVIKVWNLSSLEPVHTISGLYHWVRSLAFNLSKDRLYSGSHNTIEIWETRSPFKMKGKITHDNGSVHSLVVTKQYIVAGTYNQNIHLFDVATCAYVEKLSGHIGVISSMVTSPSGRFLFSASSDMTIQVWNLENRLPTHGLSRHEGSVNTLVLYNDLLLSGSEDTEIKVFKYTKIQPGLAPV